MSEFEELAPTPETGLGADAVAARLAEEGYNELPQQEKRTLFKIVIDVLKEPMLALLLAGGIVYLLIGEPFDAGLLLLFACLSIGTTIVQEARSEKVLEALKNLTSPRALVIRDGETRRIAGREVVRGDLMLLGEGDRVPADAVLIRAEDLLTDESLLTGESVPVKKRAAETLIAETHRPGGDDLPFVFSGSLVVRGSGLAQVTATGPRSEIGRIGQSLSGLETEPKRLQQQTRKLVVLFAVFGIATSLLAVVLYGMLRGDWLEGLLAGIALGMSMLPEEFPVVLTVFMVMGAWRISKANVLTRQSSSIETLGSATVLCTDKTGTLTENRMSVSELRAWTGQGFAPPERRTGDKQELRNMARCGAMACERQPFDPMEQAFQAFGAEELGDSLGETLNAWQRIKSFGLRPDLLAVSHVWQPDNGAGRFVAAKGAPEAIAELCGLGDAALERVHAQVAEMAARGLRVIGIAEAEHADGDLPETQRGFAFRFLGLSGLADPLRDGVAEAIGQCRSAGIRVAVISGDFPETARAIAEQAGIGTEGVMTGDVLAGLSDEELQEQVRTANVFARIMPEQKLRIVTALKANGEIVAMTGDGVNDAPSLKAAHIGVAMGGRGTDVAREASSIVLLKDDFSSIVTAVRLGRRIYDNLRKAMSFIFAVHLPIAGMALLPLITGMPVIFAPIHIAFLEMVIDPVCSLVFEAETEEDDIMRRPPRDPDEPLFTANMVMRALMQGLLAFVLVGGVYFWGLSTGLAADAVRALTFLSLVLVIVSLIFANRSFSTSLSKALTRPNKALIWVLLMVVTTLGVALFVPVARDLFRFGQIGPAHILVALGAALVSLIVAEQLKRFLRPPGRLGRAS